MAARSELTRRVLTALFGGSVVLSLIIFGQVEGTRLFTAVISLAMIWEFSQLAFEGAGKKFNTVLLLSLTLGLHLLLNETEFYFLFVTGAFLSVIAYFLFSAKYFGAGDLSRHIHDHVHEMMSSVFALAYLGLCPLFFPLIRAHESGLHWCLLFLLINWVGDSGAYFIGKKWGKRKLYPLISPKKTVEGAIGGTLAAFAACLLYAHFFFPSVAPSLLFLITVLVSVVAQLGDLVESLIKRGFGKKDSGSLLPGHGGFFDRFDGFVMSAPVMFALL